MCFRAWLRQVLRTIQEKLYYFPYRRGDQRPENGLMNSSTDDRRTGSPGDEESPPSPRQSCACRKEWDVNSHRLPHPHLPAGNKGFYMRQGVPLYKATLDGDWEEMQRILNRNDRTILRSSLTMGHETALHVAVGARQATIVGELVGRMEPQDLELQDGIGNTAFCVAVATGSVKLAEILMRSREEVALMRGARNKTPLYIAAVAGHPEMVRFVYENFRQHINHLDNDELRDIFFACIHASLFDLAIKMLEVHTDLAWARNDNEETALGILARKPSAFAGKSSTSPTRCIDYLCCGFNTISMQKKALELPKLLCETMSSDERKSFQETVDHVSEFLFAAAKLGKDKFLAVLIRCYPDLIFTKDEHNRSIFHLAVLHRHASIFNLIHNLGLQKDVIVLYTVSHPHRNRRIFCNMLHLAAKLPSLDRLSIVSGAALQMQRELLWFKEVENLTPPSEREKRDSKDKLTPRELFTKEHERLRKAGEEWMRSTAGSGMLVATLVTTVVFTTASTLPGGNDQNEGYPLDITKSRFQVFMVSDAVAMCSSIISALMFLSILNSRYAEEDFLIRLPLKLLAGFTTLLLSMTALMVSFAAMFSLAYDKDNLALIQSKNSTSLDVKKLTWVPHLASAMSYLPIILFLVLEYKLLVMMFSGQLLVLNSYFDRIKRRFRELSCIQL